MSILDIDDSGDTAALAETFPTRPHLQLPNEELESLHPRTLAPPDEPLQDLACDECDQVCKHGLQLAKEVREVTAEC